jgi:hypothetical protein
MDGEFMSTDISVDTKNLVYSVSWVSVKRNT